MTAQIHEASPTMPPHPLPPSPPDSSAQIRQWQLLVDELNRLNAQLQYLKLMLRLDLKRRSPND